uniref:uncharacterized serine-rich protein C215.13-like n=1 Tax=Erigeron canadensis TaxID=72917 RepID=UPI001CB92DDD|nr:uncharacterized serine-rich protein C215.13-like [Erigeron canadensis]
MRPQSMGSGNRQTERQISTEDVNFKRRRSFSWDTAFFTNEGFLDAEELSSIIEGGGDDVKYELEKIDEIESLEAKLFEEIEASTQKSGEISNLTKSSIKVASGKKDAQPKKVTGPVGPCRAAPIKTQSTSGGSPGNIVKSSSATVSKRSIGSKPSKAMADSPSKTPPGTKTKNKMAPVITRLPRTSPSSPISPGSSSSPSAVNQQSKRGSLRSLVSNEKLSATNARRQDDRKTGKCVGGLILKATSSISLKNKPPPLNSHPTSPLGLCNSTSSSTTQRPPESSLSTSTVDQRSRARRGRGTSVHNRSLNSDASAISTLKGHPTNQIPERQGKQPAGFGLKAGSSTRSSVQSTGRGMPASKGKSSESRVLPGMSKTDAAQHSKSGSPIGAKARKPSPIKMVPNSQKTSMPKTSQRQSSVTAKRSISASRGVQNIFLISPEVLDIKGKINALKMEIDMQKKDRCKEIKKVSAGSGKGDTTSIYVGQYTNEPNF